MILIDFAEDQTPEGAIPHPIEAVCDIQCALSAVTQGNVTYAHFNPSLSDEELKTLNQLNIIKGSIGTDSESYPRTEANTECIGPKIKTYLEKTANSPELSKSVIEIICKLKLQFATATYLNQEKYASLNQEKYEIMTYIHASSSEPSSYSWHIDYRNDENYIVMFMTLKGKSTAFCNFNTKDPNRCEKPDINASYDHAAFGLGSIGFGNKAVHSVPVGPHPGGRIFLQFTNTANLKYAHQAV